MSLLIATVQNKRVCIILLFVSLSALLNHTKAEQKDHRQLFIQITNHPNYTPEGAELYIAGNFNDWNPSDREYRFSHKEGIFQITIEHDLITLEFKITRGSWETVETNPSGWSINNRVFTQTKNSDSIKISIQGWEDLSRKKELARYITTFKILNIPSNTPHEAHLYLTGNFNNWIPKDTATRFTKTIDGHYICTLFHHFDTLKYKITRGTWTSAEAKSNGRARANRLFIPRQRAEVVWTEVSSWEDIVFIHNQAYLTFLVIAAIIGILLIIALNSVKDRYKIPNRILSILIGLCVIVLLGRASIYVRELFNWQPKTILIPELVLFSFSPLFYLYIRALLNEPLNKKWIVALLFLPSVVHLLVYLPYLKLDNFAFIYGVIDQKLFPVFSITGAVAFTYNVVYWFFCAYQLLRYKRSTQAKSKKTQITFISIALRILGGYLIIWGIAITIFASGYVWHWPAEEYTDRILDALWLLFSFFFFYIGYYAMKQPEVFKEETNQEKYRESSIDQDEYLELKNRMQELLAERKVYKDPNINLARLAELMHTNSHTVSQFINQEYQKSFFNLINENRIKEFVFLMNHDPLRKSSFLEVAFEVGFNSKTTFNRAFKSYYGLTPSEYFKSFKKDAT